MAETISSAKKLRPALPTLPSKIVFEILTRLQAGKPVARCKCVCKSWLSMIRGAEFQRAYRSRHRVLILYWCEAVHRAKWQENGGDLRLRFYYSPLRRLNEPPPPDDCCPLLELGLNSWEYGLTQVVNGLVCCQTPEKTLTLHNVFTGEKMKLRDPRTMFDYNRSIFCTYHLGHVSMTGEYKILRLLFPLGNSEKNTGEYPVNLPLRAQTMVLRPSGSKWKQIKYKGSGLDDLGLPSRDVYNMVLFQEARTFSGDGVVCWLDRVFGLIMFDFYEEKFRRVELPEDVERNEHVFVRNSKHCGDLVRVFIRTRFGGSTSSLALYVLPLKGNPECFVLDDYKDIGRWRKEDVEFSEEIRGLNGRLGAASGDEMLLLIGNHQENSSRVVHSYGDDKSVERFLVGNLPNNKPFDLYGSRTWEAIKPYNARLSCLHDSNVVYQSINDVLSHAANDDGEPDDDHVVKKWPDYDVDGGDGVKWPKDDPSEDEDEEEDEWEDEDDLEDEDDDLEDEGEDDLEDEDEDEWEDEDEEDEDNLE